LPKLLSIDPQVLKRLRRSSKEEKVGCVVALCDLAEGFGQPHAHRGLGIRKLGARLFECRAGLSLRFVFQDRPDDLFVAFLGTHDEVRRLLRSGKYP
jgi:hypothetical protein